MSVYGKVRLTVFVSFGKGSNMSDIPRISPEEARILGCLIEKQITTPEYYPLTLNALVLACNQKSNRNPVVSYDQELVTYYLDTLRDLHMAALVSEAGARVPKYKHTVSEILHLDPGEVAVLCELLLRGPSMPISSHWDG